MAECGQGWLATDESCSWQLGRGREGEETEAEEREQEQQNGRGGERKNRAPVCGRRAAW